MDHDDPNQCISVSDCAKLLSVSPSTVHRLIKAGVLHIKRMPGRTLILHQSVVQYLRSLPSR